MQKSRQNKASAHKPTPTPLFCQAGPPRRGKDSIEVRKETLVYHIDHYYSFQKCVHTKMDRLRRMNNSKTKGTNPEQRSLLSKTRF